MADVITLITSDHREMEKLFTRLEKDRSDRPELLRQVSARLTAHARAEEVGVYPAIAREAGEEDQVEHSEDEHEEAESLLHVLERTEPESSDFEERLHQLIDAVKHHMAEEETDILPALRSAVSKKRLDELGKIFDDRRRQELSALGIDEAASGMSGISAKFGTSGAAKTSGRTKGRGPAAKSDTGRSGTGRRGSAQSGSGRSGTAESEPTKDDLYQAAQEHDIPGRSSMSKSELADAVDESTGTGSPSGPGRSRSGTGRSGGSGRPAKGGRGSGSRSGR